MKAIELDGRTGEGGGQLVRIAVGLSALTGIPIHVHHVRGNREGSRGGGLKAQHYSCVKWLAEATNAEVTGCVVGSHEFTFKPNLPPTHLLNRNIKINADSAASTLLVFQAIFPFLLFAGDEKGSPIHLTIRGGTNVSFSLSYEYLDQVLLPTLEKLSVPKIERSIEYCRGWSHGTRQIGGINLKFTPLRPGQSLQASIWPPFSVPGPVGRIDISLIVPKELRDPLKESLGFATNLLFPDATVNFVLEEDSKHQARTYVLLVAHTTNGFRLGRDWLYDKKTKGKSIDRIATEIAQGVADGLDREIRRGGCVDEHLNDQLIVFQALAEGRTLIPESAMDDSRMDRVETTDEPFGNGSMHAKTARWIVSQMLPRVKWRCKGQVCDGIGWNVMSPGLEEVLDSLILKD